MYHSSNTASSPPLALFEAFGIELEYMIVDAETLEIRAIADTLLEKAHGSLTNEYNKPGISWCNELALHVIEFKTTRPESHIELLEPMFSQDIRTANNLLAPLGAQLMPTAMHPWMDPATQMHLWPHDDNAIYKAFNEIFDCRGHGWTNLQSCHINLPFANEQQFVALHAAIRLILPILPAIAASSPIAEGAFQGHLDYRALVYQSNAAKIPSITGKVIPEVCRSYRDYHEGILNKIYQDLAPYDKQGLLQSEWSNARGAIARFGRQSIEIRLLDIQETPIADLSIAAAVTAIVHSLVDDLWNTKQHFHSFSEMRLKSILDRCILHGSQAIIDDEPFLKLFAFPQKHCIAAELWQHLIETTLVPAKEAAKETGDKAQYQQMLEALSLILQKGTLAERILAAMPKKFSRYELKEVYQQLCYCLQHSVMFK